MVGNGFNFDMRVRKKNWTETELAINPRLIAPPESNRGRWREYFGNTNPVHAEIGCGKGRFINEMAARHPDVNFVALEREKHVVVSGLRTSRELQHAHTPVFAVCDAEQFPQVFADGELDRIYINFCDPWPRGKWVKRRLTHRRFLELYRAALAPGGSVFFKTDNMLLFDFSLAEFTAAGWRLAQVTRDLHQTGYTENVMTEYEEKFFLQGMPIFRCEAYR